MDTQHSSKQDTQKKGSSEVQSLGVSLTKIFGEAIYVASDTTTLRHTMVNKACLAKHIYNFLESCAFFTTHFSPEEEGCTIHTAAGKCCPQLQVLLVRTTSLPCTLPSERYYMLGLSTATIVPNQGKMLLKITQPSWIIRFFHQGGHEKGISTFRSYGVAPLSTNLVKCTSKGRGFLPILMSS